MLMLNTLTQAKRNAKPSAKSRLLLRLVLMSDTSMVVVFSERTDDAYPLPKRVFAKKTSANTARLYVGSVITELGNTVL